MAQWRTKVLLVGFIYRFGNAAANQVRVKYCMSDAIAGHWSRLGARLRDARLRQGLTIDQVGTRTNLTNGFISRIERDLTRPA